MILRRVFARIRDFIAGRTASSVPFIAMPGVLPPSWQPYAQYVSIHPTALIAPSSTLKIFNPPDPPEICVEIGARSHIFSSFSLLRSEAKIRVGRDCQLGASHFVAAKEIVLGNDILVAWGANFIDSDTHSTVWQERRHDVKRCYEDYLADPANIIKHKSWEHVPMLPIAISDKCWIGLNAIILKGVKIGNNVIVGAGAVVTSDVEAFKIVAGNPARVIGVSE